MIVHSVRLPLSRGIFPSQYIIRTKATLLSVASSFLLLVSAFRDFRLAHAAKIFANVERNGVKNSEGARGRIHSLRRSLARVFQAFPFLCYHISRTVCAEKIESLVSLPSLERTAQARKKMMQKAALKVVSHLIIIYKYYAY